MTQTNFRSAALSALVLLAAAAAVPASAQETVVVPAGARAVDGQTGAGADAVAVPPNAVGHFTCAYNESHTRLERQNCGGSHYRYGF